MTFETTPTPEPTPARRRFLGRVPRAALTAGVAVGLALGGAGIAFAATSSGSSSTTTPATKPSTNPPRHGARPFGPGFGGPGFGGPGVGGPGVAGRVVHGQYTVQTPSGTYKTVEVQTGKASKISSTSITLTSADGYSHTYAVDPSTVVDSQRDGIASVANNDQVQLEATTVSGKDTATNIVDTTKVGASRNGFGFGPPAGSSKSSGSGFGAGGPAAPAEAQ